MKKISCLVVAMLVAMPAHAKYSNRQFRNEVARGIDIVGAELNANVVPDDAPGALGLDVYQKVGTADNSGITMFIPTSMYVRAGAGLNLPFATDCAGFDGKKHESAGSYTTQIGLGWNLSQIIRHWGQCFTLISHADMSRRVMSRVYATLCRLWVSVLRLDTMSSKGQTVQTVSLLRHRVQHLDLI